MKRVYIASPYTNGDPFINVRRQIDAGEELIQAGFIPYLPLLSHYHHQIYPHSYETWCSLDLAWVEVCNALLRLLGKSKGADGEVERAFKLGIPVYYSIAELILIEGMRNK